MVDGGALVLGDVLARFLLRAVSGRA